MTVEVIKDKDDFWCNNRTSESESNIPLITPAFDFIREVIPFGKDNKNGTAASSSGNTDEQSSQSQNSVHSNNCTSTTAIRGDNDVSDDDLEDDVSVPPSDTLQDNGGDKQQADKDVTSNSVMVSLSSATNRISNFFRPSTSK